MRQAIALAAKPGEPVSQLELEQRRAEVARGAGSGERPQRFERVHRSVTRAAWRSNLARPLTAEMAGEEQLDQRVSDEQLVQRRALLVLLRAQSAPELCAASASGRVHTPCPAALARTLAAGHEPLALQLREQGVEHAVVDQALGGLARREPPLERISVVWPVDQQPEQDVSERCSRLAGMLGQLFGAGLIAAGVLGWIRLAPWAPCGWSSWGGSS